MADGGGYAKKSLYNAGQDSKKEPPGTCVDFAVIIWNKNLAISSKIHILRR